MSSRVMRSRHIQRRAEQESEFTVPGVFRAPHNSRAPIGSSVGNWMMPEANLDANDERAVAAASARLLKEGIEEERDMQMRAMGKDVPTEPGKYGVWVLPRKKLPDVLKTWASTSAAGDGQRMALEKLADEEVPKGWSVWALSSLEGLPGPGFYIAPPREPQALVIVEAVDGGQNNIQHVAANPAEISEDVKTAFADWVDSLRPKKVVVKRPNELALFGLDVLVAKKSGQAGGAKVSKGL